MWSDYYSRGPWQMHVGGVGSPVCVPSAVLGTHRFKDARTQRCGTRERAGAVLATLLVCLRAGDCVPGVGWFEWCHSVFRVC